MSAKSDSSVEKTPKHQALRFGIALTLLVWTGANLFMNLLAIRDVLSGGFRTIVVSLLFIGVTVLVPLVIAIWLLRSVMPTANSETK